MHLGGAAGMAQWRRKCRRFKVGSRKDYQGSVRTALLELGLCETSSDYFDVFWGEEYQAETYVNVKSHALVSSIPGLRASFGDKVAFANLHDACLAEQARRRRRPGADEGVLADVEELPTGDLRWTVEVPRDATTGALGLDLEQDIEGRVMVGAVTLGAPAAARLRAGDVLEKVGDVVVSGDLEAVAAALANTAPHDRDVATLQVRRPAASTDYFCDWTKRSFNLEVRGPGDINADVTELRAHARSIVNSNEWPQLWILKPQQSFNQIGISMVYLDEVDTASDESAEHWLRQALPPGLSGSWTLQEYVMHPLLYKKRKFDLRVWALITSLEPLRLFMLSTAFPKISSVDYSAAAEVVGRHCLSTASCACMHIRMPGGDGCDPRSLPKPYPPHTASRLWSAGLDYGPQFKGRSSSDPAQDASLWERAVVPQIERIVAWVTLLARAEPLRLHRLSLQQPSRCRRFVLLSPDFIVDSHGQAFLEEMNVNGFMVGDEAFYHGQRDTLDALRVLGADGWPKRPLYEGRASRLIDGFVAEQGLDAHDEAVVRPPLLELMHEEAAAFPTSWYRVFPDALASAQMERLVETLAPEAELTDLDEATADFLRFRLQRFTEIK